MQTKFHERVRSFGLSPEGEKWLRQAVYPPGPDTKCSVPNADPAVSLRADYRPARVVAFPSIDGISSWDVMVLATPGDNVAAFVVAAPSPCDFSSAIAPTHGVASVINYSTNTAQSRTFIDNVYSATPTSRTLYASASPVGQVAFRHAYKGVTIHHTASDLNNGGTVTCAQYDSGIRDTQLYDTAVSGPVTRCFGIACGAMCLDEVSMTMLAPDAHSAPAKEGVFAPIRVATQGYVPVAVGPGRVQPATTLACMSMATANQFGGFPQMLFDSFGPTPKPWWLTTLMNGPHPLLDSAFDSSNTLTSVFRGLSPQATLTVQVFAGLEYVLDPSSSFAPLAQMPAAPDARAVEAYKLISTETSRVYPASANFLGTALTVAGQAARALAPYALQAAKALAPSAIAALGGVLERAAERPVHRPARHGESANFRPRARSVSTVRSRASRKPVRKRRARILPPTRRA